MIKIRYNNPEHLGHVNTISTDIYQQLYNSPPNTIEEYYNIEVKLVLDKLKDLELEEILFKGVFDSKNQYVDDAVYYKSKIRDVILGIRTNKIKNKICVGSFYINFPITMKSEIINYLQEINKLRKKEKKVNRISTVGRNAHGFFLKSFIVNKPKFSILENYEDIDEVHSNILKRLNTKNDKGIALFYGEPGCGKTNYIRFLLTKLKKTVIYLPPDMATMISSPDFLPFLMDYPNSVLVIEDAENILKSRKSGGSQSTANLLNLGDGLLSDILNIQIVATFNCNYSEIDSALLRKGRLIAKHEFKKLSIEKGQKLSDKLGFTTTITEPMALCDIYNQDQKNYNTKKTKIGFDAVPKKVDNPNNGSINGITLSAIFNGVARPLTLDEIKERGLTHMLYKDFYNKK